MKKAVFTVIIVLVIIAVGVFCLYNSGYMGITHDSIIQKQMETVSWNEHDFSVTGSGSDDVPLFAGIMYMKDFSDAKYFIYVNKSGFKHGWHFLQSGGLTDIDGLREFDCGKYGKVCIALNSYNNIQKIEFESGEPSVFENTDYPIVNVAAQNETLRFYDKDGNEIIPNKIHITE